jgi:hypothetical protein
MRRMTIVIISGGQKSRNVIWIREVDNMEPDPAGLAGDEPSQLDNFFLAWSLVNGYA